MSTTINISQILMKRGNTAAAKTYVGPLGELLVDTGLQSLRLQDGATPGGMSTLATNAQIQALSRVISNISIGTYSNANVVALLGAFGSNNISTTGTANIGAVNMSSNINWGRGSQVFEDSGLVLQGATRLAITSPGTTQITAGAAQWNFTNDGTLTLPGRITQSGGAVAIGSCAGHTTQGGGAVAIGNYAGQCTQGGGAVAIGNSAGQTTQGSCSVAIGYGSGSATQGSSSIAIGSDAGSATQGGYSVAIGSFAGHTTQGGGAVAIGFFAGYNTQCGGAVAIGNSAGQCTQGGGAVAIGSAAGQCTQGGGAVAIGSYAGQCTQGGGAVAIGNSAGQTTQGSCSVAIGSFAGHTTQGGVAVAIGSCAGHTTQGGGAVAIGNSAGQCTQGSCSVAIGNSAGSQQQGQRSVAIGYCAGRFCQGVNSIAIGTKAGQCHQANNTIIINASISAINGCTTGNRFYVAPVRVCVSSANVGNVMMYNPISNEITYSNTISIIGNLVTSANAIASNFLYPNGVSLLSTIAPSSLYSNSNVQSYMSNFGSNVITTTANITAGNILTNNHLYANGVSILTGVTYNYSNSNVQSYLPIYSGNISPGNVNVVTTINAPTITVAGNLVAGNIRAIGTISYTNQNFGSQTYSVLVANSTVNTTTANTGALQVWGGAWINSNANVGGSVISNGFFYPNNQSIFNNITAGNLAFGTNSVIFGDFTNSTVNYRTIFQPNATNSNPGVYVVPSGTGTAASWQATNNSNLTNASKILIATNGTTDVQLVSGINGSGTYLPLSFYTSGSAQMQLGTAGNLLMVTGGNIATSGNVIAGNILTNNHLYANGVSILTGVTYNYSNANVVANLQNYVTNITSTANITAGNVIVTGNIYSNGNVAVVSNLPRNVWVSTAAPLSTQGNVGDIWYQTF